MTAPESWLQLGLRVDGERLERAEQALLELGAHSVTLLDAGDHPVHEPAPGETPLWPDIVVQGLFDGTADLTDLTERLVRQEIIGDPTALIVEHIDERDWTRAWMDRYQPLRFGQSLWICPSHIEPDPDWPLVIRLDPGLAFGSGTHPTTALCLEWIDSQALAGKRVIDFGCGSGILAIACALKGAERVIAVDHDPQALLATADNAERNHLAAKIECLLPDQFQVEPVEVVLANILAGPLIELAPRLAECVAPGGSLVLSGILPEQADAVAAAYKPFLGPAEYSQREDWMRLRFGEK
ncbi:MAG: 50S ribosomal protein L11 methyltransferase [Wenzhouxiangella sp.]|nr:MAG: 50S ribosomal protein L11 methyltransferase [Wenzhouxiangella sp.]